MKAKHKRMTVILAALLCMGLALFMILRNFNDNLVFFYSPTDVVEKNIKPDKIIRIGGLIKDGSVERPSPNQIIFIITDLSNEIIVEYKGLLPALFREGQGMVARGKLGANGVFVADNLLAKHDEKYMPPEVAKALKKSGKWKENK